MEDELVDTSITWQCVRKAAVLLDLVLQCNALQASDGAINPIDDLAELRATIDFVRSSLTPRLQAGYDVAATDLAAEICMREVLATLDTLTQFVTAFLLSKLRAPLPHGQRALTVEMWRDKRIYLYQLDFLLKLQVDQFSNLFLAGVDAASLIEDSEGQQLWISCFGGRHITMVPWHVFWKLLIQQFGPAIQSEEAHFKLFLNPTRTKHVSAFEFATFLKWFGAFSSCSVRFLEAINGGLIAGFVPALEATALLEGKPKGTYLIRMSKTRPGSYAVTFIDNMGATKHCLLHSVPGGVTLKDTPTIYPSVKTFALAHHSKLRFPRAADWAQLIADAKRRGEERPEPRAAAAKAQPKAAEPAEDGLSDKEACVVCFTNAIDAVFVPCGHMTCCSACANQLDPQLCPMCRVPIAQIVKVFTA